MIMDQRVLQTVLLLLQTSLLYLTGLLIYRLTFHPLAKYPGSKLAAATKWYEFYFDILKGQGGQFTFEVDRMHEIYGPIIRINPDEIHIRDPFFYGTLYGAPGSVRDKYPPAANMLGTELGLFGTISHHLHRQRRNAINTLFSKKTILSRLPDVRQHIEKLCQSLVEEIESKGCAEIRAKYLAFTTDVITEHCFGGPWGLLQNSTRATEWKDAIAAMEAMTPFAKQFPWLLPIGKYLPLWLIAQLPPTTRRLLGIFQYSTELASKTLQEFDETAGERPSTKALPDTESTTPYRPTVFQTILASNLPPEEKRLQRMAEEGVVVVSAGGETVARTLTCCTFHLLDNPDVTSLLKEELSVFIPDANAIPDSVDLEKLPVLTAVIKECLRMASVTSSRLPIISPIMPLRYGKWNIPAGIPVSMSPHKTLMDPTVYEEPHIFRPQRWLSSKDKVLQMERCFVAFGKGHRSCLGINLAYAELYTTLATLFRRFDFELVDVVRERDIDLVRDCFVGEPSIESTGVRIRIKRPD